MINKIERSHVFYLSLKRYRSLASKQCKIGGFDIFDIRYKSTNIPMLIKQMMWPTKLVILEIERKLDSYTILLIITIQGDIQAVKIAVKRILSLCCSPNSFFSSFKFEYFLFGWQYNTSIFSSNLNLKILFSTIECPSMMVTMAIIHFPS